jgi:hypothetical protein
MTHRLLPRLLHPTRNRAVLAGAVLLAVLAALLLATDRGAALESGTDAVVRADGDCLRMRAEPTLSAQILQCLAEGTTVTVLPGTQNAEGYVWRLISAGGTVGWVVEQYLEQAGAPPAGAPSPTPAPTQAMVGDVPVTGGVGLVVWNGGPTGELVSTARGRGCDLSSLWSADGGTFIGYIDGAPAIANAAWEARHTGGQLDSGAPFILVCRGLEPPPGSGAGPLGPAGLPPGMPALPPGPAGNI